MSSLRNLERILYKSIDNKNISYPMIDEDSFAYMDAEASFDNSKVICFLYFSNNEGRKYIDFYVWDVMLPNGYKRFILEPGYVLAEDDEEMFIGYLHEDILVERFLFENCIRRIEKEYPEIHLKRYEDWRQTLLHVYYTFHRAGPYEILFKANLNYFAASLECIDEYNLIGSSPEKILDVQLGMLRAMNSPYGLEVMESVENRKWARHLYSRYHNLIRGSTINKYQWHYLKEQEECEEAVDKKMYRFLGTLSCDNNYYSYLKYMKQKQIVDNYYGCLPKYPDENDLKEHVQVCNMIEWYIEHERDIDNCLRDKVQQYRDDYTFETSEYIVLMPSSLKELLKEAQNQHNCLHRYVLRTAYNDTIILFMREKGKEQDSLITIEIENGVINQALRSHNRVPDEMQKSFLEEYANLKNLILPTVEYFDWDEDDEFD